MADTLNSGSATPKSKSLATWLALLGGLLGAHRFYLHGWRDGLAWLHPVLSLIGLAGVIRMRNLGQDDHAAWLLIPLFGAMVVVAMLSTIVLGLTTDERWAERRGQPLKATRWAPVIAVVIAMLLGGAALMGTLAFSGQMFFEYQKLT
jgi:ABC-type Fe3+-siderophore transport system permease subunit